MDLRKDIDYVMNHKLGLDDTFQFRCKGCGKCCTHREDESPGILGDPRLKF